MRDETQRALESGLEERERKISSSDSGLDGGKRKLFEEVGQANRE